MKRIPVLDGIRGLAIALVVSGHIALRLDQAVGTMMGSLGVDFFFVLSGYLITRVLLHEEALGNLSLPGFYKRRALRIFPAFYMFLLTLGLLVGLGWLPHKDSETWLASAFYFRNIYGSGWDTAHLWSLSLEEQFYVTWPIVFILIKRRRLAFIAVSVIGFTLHRAVWLHGHSMDGLRWLPNLRLDTFLIGAAFAIEKRKPQVPPELAIALLIIWFPFAPLAPVLRPVDTVVSAFLIGCLIVWIVENSTSWAGRLFSARGIAGLGIVSYSVYLWQQIFLGPHLCWWSLPALAITSFVSYRLVERPAIRLKNRWSRSALNALENPLASAADALSAPSC